MCAVGGALSPAAFVDGEHLTCAAPPLPARDRTPRTVHLAVSNDGGATLGGTRPYTYYDASEPPSLASASPRYMALATTGNLTVSGGNMAPTAALACVFQPPPQLGPLGPHEGATSPQSAAISAISVPARFVSVDEVSCTAPSSEVPTSWSLSLTTDGATLSAPPLLFTRYEPARPATIARVAPLASGLAQRALLTVRGTNLAPTPRLACSFEVGA